MVISSYSTSASNHPSNVVDAKSDKDKDNNVDVVDYGYGDESTSAPSSSSSRGGTGQEEAGGSAVMSTKLPRRSSLKMRSSYGPSPYDEQRDEGSARPRRRASISYTGEIQQAQQRQQQQCQRRRRTSISFRDGDDDVKEVEPVRYLTDEPSNVWIQKDELYRIRQQAALLINLARQKKQQNVYSSRRGGSSSEDNKEVCTRGLERFLDDRASKDRIQQSRDSVLAAQERARSGGDGDDIDDDDDHANILSRIYSKAAAESCDKARDRAEIDHAQMRQEYRMTRRMMRRMSVS